MLSALLRQKHCDLKYFYFQTSVQKVLKRIEDVHGMCESRKDQIKKLVSVPKRPVQAVKPEPVPTAQVDGDLKRKGTTENTYRHPDIYEKSARVCQLLYLLEL